MVYSCTVYGTSSTVCSVQYCTVLQQYIWYSAVYSVQSTTILYRHSTVYLLLYYCKVWMEYSMYSTGTVSTAGRSIHCRIPLQDVVYASIFLHLRSIYSITIGVAAAALCALRAAAIAARPASVGRCQMKRTNMRIK
jgi:hypothetical protein